MRVFVISTLSFMVLSNSLAVAKNPCSDNPGEKAYAELLRRKAILEKIIPQKIDHISFAEDLETEARKVYNVSSTVSYGLIGVGASALIAGAGVTALSGGKAGLSLRLGSYVAGNTINTNTVGIGGALLTGGAAGSSGRSLVLAMKDEKKCFDIGAISFSYQPSPLKSYDPMKDYFKEARLDLQEEQEKLAKKKGADSIIDWNGKRELTRTQLLKINLFYQMQLAALQLEHVRRSIEHLSKNCHKDKVMTDLDVEFEIKKILKSYKSLDKLSEIPPDGEGHFSLEACLKSEGKSVDNSDRSEIEKKELKNSPGSNQYKSVTPQ